MALGSVAPAEGLSVAGKYRLLRPLARGSMGEVWIASHETLGGELAIKFMTQQEGPEVEDAATAIARFQFEAQVAARLSRRSRHIVAVTDHGHEWGHAYLVMEFVEGESLGEVIARQAPLELSLVATFTSQLAKGLAQAHAEGLFHRDLKPANVLLTRDEDGGVLAKILDFGIAKATRRHYVAPPVTNMPNANASRPGVGHETEQGVVLGTPNYMSPEQARGLATLDHRCDVWALGVIAYEALTSFLPYDGETTADLLVNICTTRSVPVRHYNEALPEALEPFFLKAFAPKVNDRFQTAVELGDAIMAIARDVGRIPKIVTAPPPPQPVEVPVTTAAATTNRSAQVPPGVVSSVEVVDKPTARTFTTGAGTPVALQSRWPLWAAIAALLVGGTVIAIKMSASGSKDSGSAAVGTEVTSSTTSMSTNSVLPPPSSAAVMPTGPTTTATIDPKTTASVVNTGGLKVPGTAKTTATTTATVSATATATVPSVSATPSATVTTKKSVDKGEIL